MFDNAPVLAVVPARGGSAPPGVALVDAAEVRRWSARLADVSRDVPDAERVEQLRALEDLKSAAAAAQARVAAGLDASVRAEHARAGLPAAVHGRGVAAQVALARRDSPSRGGQHLGLANALVHEMPHTLAALQAGLISEWRATLLVRETACLTLEHRRVVDRELAADPAALDGVGDRALVGRARSMAYRLDPQAAVRRVAKAESERRVTLRPAPDTMAVLTAPLPVAQGVAAYAALTRAADAARAAGDPRTRGQIMADTLVERLTGTSIAANVPVAVRLVITDRALLDGSADPAHLDGYGPVPAARARRIVADGDGEVWLRRLFTHPDTGELVAMDSRARAFPAGLGELITLRDQICRTPWCDAPIRHTDHVRRVAEGGDTSAANGQGLCEQCNYVKEAPGWSAVPDPESRPGRHVVTTTTPTGHAYSSRPPPMPGAA
jgi:hypothetical protein